MKTVEIVFSPTGGTQKVADIICGSWGGDAVKVDLTNPALDPAGCAIAPDDRVLIAMPSFGGRAPAVAIERLRRISGNGAMCTLVCAYGNRAYDGTLAEMEYAAGECGFKVIAAVAAVAEHSIVTQYAAGRPDEADAVQLAGFAAQIANKAEGGVAIPGVRPGAQAGKAGIVPAPTADCVKCGLCAKRCPVQAIDPASLVADAEKCISCMRCVSKCPKAARKVDEAVMDMVANMLREPCSVRKENELFI